MEKIWGIFLLLGLITCGKKSSGPVSGFTSDTARIHVVLPDAKTKLMESDIKLTPPSQPSPITQSKMSFEEVSLIEATYGDVPASNISVLLVTLACKVLGENHQYDPINGCVEIFTNQEKQACSTDQWSDALGCVPVETSIQTACKNQKQYWVGGVCQRAYGLSQSQCGPENGANLEWYGNACLNNPAQVDCLKGGKYWFSAGSGGSCLPLEELSQTLCEVYKPLLHWKNGDCLAGDATWDLLGQVIPSVGLPAIAGLGSPVCLDGETLLPNQSGCVSSSGSIPSSSYLGTILTGNKVDKACSPAVSTPIYNINYYKTDYAQSYNNGLIIVCGYAGNSLCCNPSSHGTAFSYIKSWSFSCPNQDSMSTGALINSYSGTSWTHGNSPTVSTTLTCTDRKGPIVSFTVPSWSKAGGASVTTMGKDFPGYSAADFANSPYSLRYEEITISCGDPVNGSRNYICSTSNLFWQNSGDARLSCPVDPEGRPSWITGFDASGNLVCAVETPRPLCYRGATRNSDGTGRCDYTNSTAQAYYQTKFQANQRANSSMVGVPDSRAAMEYLCPMGHILFLNVSLSDGNASSLSLTCGTGSAEQSTSLVFGAASMNSSPLPLGTSPSLTIYATSAQIVGYQNDSLSVAVGNTNSGVGISTSTLSCASGTLPVGVRVKSTGTAVTQLGFICGAWEVF